MWSVQDYPQEQKARRRGPFRAGERVQLTDSKNRRYTITLTADGYFQSRRGSFYHRDLIGKEEGTLLTTATGHKLLAFRPLISDYVLSMPRGATVIYPKDAGQIVHYADIFPGAQVVEAGLGSGALAISLLAAVGKEGHLTSVERRPEYADIARANVESWYGSANLPWEIKIGDLAEVLADLPPAQIDRVVLDMLAPWENIAAAARVLVPGGVFLAYVTTIPQLSRLTEELRISGEFTDPTSFEILLRPWHVEGLSIRPVHSMVAHTGFLLTARRLANESAGQLFNSEQLSAAVLPFCGADSDWEAELDRDFKNGKRIRKIRRAVARRADQEESGLSHPGENMEKLEAQLRREQKEKRCPSKQPE